MIDQVTDALVDHLAARTADVGSNWIDVTSLESGTALTANHLHVCLYAIAEHDHLRNAPHVLTANGWQRPPLGLRLHYVVTYAGNNHLEVQARLARVLQVFHTTPVLGPAELPPEVASVVERVTVRLRSPSHEERNHLWTAFSRPMKLSLYYDVDVALIPLAQAQGAGTVLDHRIDYAELAAP